MFFYSLYILNDKAWCVDKVCTSIYVTMYIVLCVDGASINPHMLSSVALKFSDNRATAQQKHFI